MANSQHVEILTQGIDAWNQWRADNAGVKPDLSYLKIHKADLPKINFQDADFTGTKFYELKLNDANFCNAALDKVEIYNTNLLQADFRDAKLNSAEIYQTNLSKADFRDASLKEAKLFEVDLTYADFTTCAVSDEGFLYSTDRGLRYANRPYTGANLEGIILRGSDLSHAKLDGANLARAMLQETQFISSSLYRAELINADLRGADFSNADLREALLIGAKLIPSISINLPRGISISTSPDKETIDREFRNPTKLRKANLEGADLRYSAFVETDLSGAVLSNCLIYGISAWNLQMENATQLNLFINLPDEPDIQVDNVELAQFIYLLLNNNKIRNVIDTVTSKVVLILGRFTEERKKILDAIREEIRQRDYLPILFDFEKPLNRDTIETMSTLAHMAKFVIADLTNAKSILQELQQIIPTLPSVPIQPLLQSSDFEPGMVDHFKNFRSFLKIYQYDTTDELIKSLSQKVIFPAEQKIREFQD